MKKKDVLSTVLSILFFMIVIIQMVFTVLVWKDIQLLKKQTSMLTAPVNTISSVFRRGEQVPSFSFKDLLDREREIDEWRGRPLLIVFASHECSACKQMYEHLDAFLERNIDLSVVIVTIDSTERNRQFVEEYHLSGSKNLTVGTMVKTDWLALDIVATPTLALVEPGGTVTEVWLGYSDALWSEIESAY